MISCLTQPRMSRPLTSTSWSPGLTPCLYACPCGNTKVTLAASSRSNPMGGDWFCNLSSTISSNTQSNDVPLGKSPTIALSSTASPWRLSRNIPRRACSFIQRILKVSMVREAHSVTSTTVPSNDNLKCRTEKPEESLRFSSAESGVCSCCRIVGNAAMASCQSASCSTEVRDSGAMSNLAAIAAAQAGPSNPSGVSKRSNSRRPGDAAAIANLNSHA
mmetsp:Transcript_83811/g.191305  ORF Transcript_83811/g.191305 Transcript_83811/m.191305 type:complete len:218 (-) Transcript_83811:8-661(-)